MRLRKDVIDKYLKENNLTAKEFAKLYHGKEGEIWVMEHIKCGFRRAYQIAEILSCTVDDIVVYTEDKWPIRNMPKRAKAKKNKESEKKKKIKEEKLRRSYQNLFNELEGIEDLK